MSRWSVWKDWKERVLFRGFRSRSLREDGEPGPGGARSRKGSERRRPLKPSAAPGATTESSAAWCSMMLRRSYGDRQSWVQCMRARVQAGYYDRPEVRAKIVGVLTDYLWLRRPECANLSTEDTELKT